MNRLTRKKEKYNEKVNDLYEPITTTREINNKLGRLEDLEEQIGCPLDVLVKAMTSKIYYDIASGVGEIVQPYLVVNDDGMFVFDTLDDTDYIYLNDYKQTWWLKEDRSE